MGKYGVFGLLMLWLIFATFLVNSAEAYLQDGSFTVDNGITQVDTTGDSDLDQIRNMGETFISAIGFQVVGLPAIISLIFFTIPTLILAYMSLDMLIALLNAIIPF